MQNIDFYLNDVTNKLKQEHIQKFKHDIEMQFHVLTNSLSTICVTKNNVYSLMVSTYNSLVKIIGSETISGLIMISTKDRPQEILKKYITLRIILVFCLVAVALKDFVLLKKILLVYASMRFYMYFISKIEYCNNDIMSMSIEKLTLKTFVKQYHGSYPKVVSRIVDNFYSGYIESYTYKKTEDLVAQIVIVLDYIRTRVKQVLQTLIKSYYEVYNNKEQYESKFQKKKEFLSLHLSQILQRFIMIVRSEKQHLSYNKNLIPDEIALVLVDGYLSNVERVQKIIQVMLSLFDKNINANPCDKEYANEIRKLYVKKKSQSYFEEIDSFNKEILDKAKISSSIILKYARYAGKSVVYRLELRSYFILLLYKSITEIFCK